MIILTDKPKEIKICLLCESGSPVTTGWPTGWHNYGKPNQIACCNSAIVPDGHVSESITYYERQ